MAVKTLHVEETESGAVRYFPSPDWTSMGVRDMPWHAVEDVWNILAGKGADLSHLLRPLRSDWREPVTVATEGGIVVIAPDFMAEGLFSAFAGADDERSWPREILRARGGYRRGRTAALKAMLPGHSQMGILAYAMEAAERAGDCLRA